MRKLQLLVQERNFVERNGVKIEQFVLDVERCGILDMRSGKK